MRTLVTVACALSLVGSAILGLVGCTTTETITTGDGIDFGSPTGGQTSIIDSRIRHFEKLIRKYPRRADLHFKICNLHFQRDEFREAAAAVDRALRITPRNVQYLYRKGRLHLRMGENPEGIVAFRKAVQCAGRRRYSGLHSALGYALCMEHRYDEAHPEFEVSIDIDPLEPLPYYFLGSIAEVREDRDLTIKYMREYLERGGKYFRGRAVEVLRFNGVVAGLRSKTLEAAEKQGIGVSSGPGAGELAIPKLQGEFELTPATEK